MNVMKCANCDNFIKPGAQFCPRCGHAAPGSISLVPAPDRLPARTPMPAGAKWFIAIVIAIPLLIVGGIFFHKALLLAGILLTVVLAVFFLLSLFM